MAKSIPWPRIVLEVMVIVGSILLAFGIDAWWSVRQDRLAERDALETLLAEALENRSTIATQVRRNREFQDAALELLEISEGAKESPPPAEVERLLQRVFFGIALGGFSRSAIEDLITSGRLSAIRDEELRLQIVDWPRRADFLEANSESFFRELQDLFEPYILEQVWARDILAAGIGGGDVPPRGGADYSELWGQMEFDNLVSFRIAIQTGQLRDLDDLAQSTDSLIALIQLGLNR